MKHSNRLTILAILTISLFYFSPIWKDKHIPFPGHLLVSFFSPWKEESWPGYPTGVPRKDLLGFDTARMMGPWRQFITEELKSGRLPTWNPHQFAGAPLLANFQSALFFPPNLIYLILPFNIAWTILVISQPILGSVGMYLLLKELFKKSLTINHQPLIIAFLAVVYGFSAWMSVWIEWNIHGFVYALLPWTLLFVYRRKIFPTILTISAIIFSGHPQMALIALTAAAVFAAVNHNLKKFLLSAAVALFITSIQWIPAVRYYQQASREQSSSEFVYEKTLLPWNQITQLIAPNFLGNPATGNFRGQANFVETTAYSGIAILGFSLIGLISQIRPISQIGLINKFSIFLLLLIFILALPNPVSLLIGRLNIPILSTSVASRWLMLWPLATILLAAAGFQSLTFALAKVRLLAASTVLILIGTVWIAAFFSPPQFRSISVRNLIIPTGIAILWIITTSVIPRPSAVSSGRSNRSTRNLYRFQLKAEMTKKLYRSSTIVNNLYNFILNNFYSISVLVILLASIYELIAFGQKTMTYTEKDFIYPSTPVIKKLQQLSTDYSRFAGTNGSAIESNFATYFGLYDLSGYDALYPRRIGELVWAANNNGEPVTDFSRSTVVTPTAPSLARDNLWNIAGVRWILNKDDMLAEHPGQRSNDLSADFKLVWEEGKWQIYENLKVFPRAFFVAEISKIPPISLITPAKITTYQSNLIKVEVDAPQDGYLVLTDTFYPGWKATVDGQEAKIIPALHAFRGVPISQGMHVIKFMFRSL